MVDNLPLDGIGRVPLFGVAQRVHVPLQGHNDGTRKNQDGGGLHIDWLLDGRSRSVFLRVFRRKMFADLSLRV